MHDRWRRFHHAHSNALFAHSFAHIRAPIKHLLRGSQLRILLLFPHILAHILCVIMGVARTFQDAHITWTRLHSPVQVRHASRHNAQITERAPSLNNAHRCCSHRISGQLLRVQSLMEPHQQLSQMDVRGKPKRTLRGCTLTVYASIAHRTMPRDPRPASSGSLPPLELRAFRPDPHRRTTRTRRGRRVQDALYDAFTQADAHTRRPTQAGFFRDAAT